MNRFTETQLEQAFIEMLQEQKYTYLKGGDIDRSPNEVLIKEDLRDYLHTRYKHEQITPVEIESIIRQLESFPSSDLYESNKAIMKMISDGFPLKREDRSKKDLFVQPIDFRKYASPILVRDKEISKAPNPYSLRIPSRKNAGLHLQAFGHAHKRIQPLASSECFGITPNFIPLSSLSKFPD
jgi:type I site-specific restriction-modification system R (restriction) subunit